MSKRSRPAKSEEYESDGGFVEDVPKGKKQKKQLSTEMQKDDEGNEYWELSGKRRVQISDFKGTTMIGVREFYEKDGKVLPGKKGIALSVEQYRTFINLLPEIERALEAKGLRVPRPHYGKAPMKGNAHEDEDGEEEEARSSKKRAKPNHEATSDEDEE